MDRREYYGKCTRNKFPGEGHINPTLAIVSELIQRGNSCFLLY